MTKKEKKRMRGTIEEIAKRLTLFRDMDDDEEADRFYEENILPLEREIDSSKGWPGAVGLYREYAEGFLERRRSEVAYFYHCLEHARGLMSDEQWEEVVSGYGLAKELASEGPMLREGDDFLLRWHCAYYDGPKDGMLELLPSGRLAWFEMAHDEYDTDDLLGTRLYRVYELSEGQLESEKYWHRLFCDNVGTHTEYHYGEDGKAWRTGDEDGTHLRPEKDWDKFYEAARKGRKPLELCECRILGWFYR